MIIYDPIIFSSLTSIDWHRRNFETLATRLEGATDEVVISFAQIYKKTRRNMDAAAKEFDFNWDEHKVPEEVFLEKGRALAIELAQTAEARGMRLKICSQKAFLLPGVVEEARCVDADRLERVSGCSISAKMRQKGNRKECGCFASKDIGEYDTCPHGCVYCYAVSNRDVALDRYKAHDPASEFLFAPRGYNSGEDEDKRALQIIPASKVQGSHKTRKSGGKVVEQGTLF